LSREEAEFEVGVEERIKMPARVPEDPDFVLRQHPIPLMLFPRRFDLHTGILFEQIATNGPIKKLADQRQHPVGLDGCPTLHDMVEERQHIAALDVRPFAGSPRREHFTGE
jgi:hypothetical protein